MPGGPRRLERATNKSSVRNHHTLSAMVRIILFIYLFIYIQTKYLS